MQQQTIIGRGIPDIAEEVLQEMLRSISVKQWIAKDTYFLTKAEVEMTMEITPEAMGLPGEGVLTIDIATALLAYNYNKPVSIVLPPEAEEAIGFGQEQRDPAETELANIQAAVVAMMVDNGLSELLNPVTVATNDMSTFPDANGTYVLYGCSVSGVSVNYVATQYTKGTYTVDKYGTVTQVTTGYE